MNDKTLKPIEENPVHEAAKQLTTGPLIEGFKGVDGQSWIRDRTTA